MSAPVADTREFHGADFDPANQYPANDDPYLVADQLREDGHLFGWTERHGAWWQWTGTAYERRTAKQLRAYLGGVLKKKWFVKTNGDPQAWAPNTSRLNNVIDALSLDPVPDPDEHVLSLANGLFNPATGELSKPTPTRFVTASAPFDYDPSAKCPRWAEFLQSVWPDDAESVALLQEWMGYVVSGRTDEQKGMFIFGPKRSGKGIIAGVLTALVGGVDHVGAIQLGSANNWYGQEHLPGKSLAVVNDMRNGKLTAAAQEFLLNTIGNSMVQILRHGREPLSVVLTCRVMVCSNVRPIFTDPSKVLPTRFLYLVMKKSHYGHEDKTLEGALAAELPGILNWCLEGLSRLVTEKKWTEPASSDELRHDALEASAPETEFFEEWCERADGATVAKIAVFDAWETWRKRHGYDRVAENTFGANLLSLYPWIVAKDVKVTYEGKRKNGYRGVRLKLA